MNLVICCEIILFKYLVDYLESFREKINASFLIIKNYDSCDFSSSGTIYLFCQKLPNKLIDFPQNNIYLINTEQLSCPSYLSRINQYLSKEIKIIDYSSANINILGPNKAFYIPYQFNDDENNYLTNLMENTPKEYDFVLIGRNHTPKRRSVIENLRQLGYKVLSLDLFWGDERDLEIAKAKILLNIHIFNERNIYESIRCDRLIFAGMLVISETSYRDDLYDMKEYLIVEEYSQIVKKAVEVIKDYDNYCQIFKEKRKVLISGDIAKQREKFCTIFKNQVLSTSLKCILEVYSANWNCNSGQESFVKFANSSFSLSHGFTVFTITQSPQPDIKYEIQYDGCGKDFTKSLENYLRNLYEFSTKDYFILINHDDSVNSTPPKTLSEKIKFLGCSNLNELKFRGAYFLIYDLRKKIIIKEICENNKCISEKIEII